MRHEREPDVRHDAWRSRLQCVEDDIAAIRLYTCLLRPSGKNISERAIQDERGGNWIRCDMVLRRDQASDDLLPRNSRVRVKIAVN